MNATPDTITNKQVVNNNDYVTIDEQELQAKLNELPVDKEIHSKIMDVIHKHNEEKTKAVKTTEVTDSTTEASEVPTKATDSSVKGSDVVGEGTPALLTPDKSENVEETATARVNTADTETTEPETETISTPVVNTVPTIETTQPIEHIPHIETTFFSPTTEDHKAANHLLLARFYELAKNEIEGKRAVAAQQSGGWFKKLANTFIAGVKNNFTTKAVKERQKELLYASDTTLTPLAKEMLQDIHETIRLTRDPSNTSESAQMARALLEHTQSAISHEKKWGFLGRSKLGFIENLKKRFGIKKDIVYSKSHTGALTTGAASLGAFTAGVMGARALLKAIPLIGGFIGGGLVATKMAEQKLKGFDTFLSEYLRDTAFQGINKYTTEAELQERLEQFSPQDRKASLAILKNLIEHAKENSAVNTIANADAFVHLHLKVDKLLANADTTLSAEQQGEFQKKVNQIRSNTRKQLITAGLIGAALGSAAAGVALTAGSYLHSGATTPQPSAVKLGTSYAQSDEHASTIAKAVSSKTVDTSHIKSFTPQMTHVDEFRKMGGVEYAVFKANDGMGNIPVYALKNGNIPIRFTFGNNVHMSGQEIDQNLAKFNMDLGQVKLRPTAVYGHGPVPPIKVTIVNDSDLPGGKATTSYDLDHTTGMVKTTVICSPRTLDEELYHAVYGISKETHQHATGIEETAVDHEEIYNIESKKQALLNTGKDNAENITKIADVHANASDNFELQNIERQINISKAVITEDEAAVKTAESNVFAKKSLEMKIERLRHIDPGVQTQVEYLRNNYQSLSSRPFIATNLPVIGNVPNIQNILHTLIRDSKGMHDVRADFLAKVHTALIDKGLKEEEWSDCERALDQYYNFIVTSRNNYLTQMDRLLTNDGSIEALKLKENIYRTDVLGSSNYERTLTHVDRAAFDQNLFHTPTRANVNLSMKFFANEVNLGSKIASMNGEIARMENEISRLEQNLSALSNAENDLSIAQQNLAYHKQELTDLQHQYAAVSGKEYDHNSTTGNNNDNGNNGGTTNKTADKSFFYNPESNKSYEEQLAMHQKLLASQKGSGGSGGAGGSLTTEGGDKNLDPATKKDYNYTPKTGKTASDVLTTAEILKNTPQGADIRYLVDQLLNSKELKGKNPSEQADLVAMALRDYMATKTLDSKLTQGEGFISGDVQEIRDIKIGNTKNLYDVLNDPEDLKKFTRMIIDTSNGEDTGITSAEIQKAFDDPAAYMSTKMSKGISSVTTPLGTAASTAYSYVSNPVGATLGIAGGAALLYYKGRDLMNGIGNMGTGLFNLVTGRYRLGVKTHNRTAVTATTAPAAATREMKFDLTNAANYTVEIINNDGTITTPLTGNLLAAANQKIDLRSIPVGSLVRITLNDTTTNNRIFRQVLRMP